MELAYEAVRGGRGGEGEGGIQLLICSPHPVPFITQMTSAQKTDPFGTTPTPFHSSHFPTELSPDENSKECRNLLKSLMCICRCGGQTGCEVPVDSTIFGDPCPGTFKYVEVHYACRKGERHSEKRIPPRRHSISLYSLSNLGGRGPQRPNSFVLPNAMEVICFWEGVLKSGTCFFLHRHREWASRRRRQSCSLT